MVDGLIIPRTYNDYFSRSDPAAIRQLVAQFTDAALSATSENPVQNKVVKAALDVINAVIPTGASANDKLVLKSSVDAIDAKIPTQASAQNQLADKDFVNSSVSTNTANYISDNGDPFASVAALEAYSGTVTNNDYAFVTGTDAAGNVYYDRYKATVSGASVSWAKEYRLNNSSFTAAQWAAISSGITAAKVAQYDAGVTPVDAVTLNDMRAVTSNAVASAFSGWEEIWRRGNSFIQGIVTPMGKLLRVRFEGLTSGNISPGSVLLTITNSKYLPTIDPNRFIVSVDTNDNRVGACIDYESDGEMKIYFQSTRGSLNVTGIYIDTLLLLL